MDARDKSGELDKGRIRVSMIWLDGSMAEENLQ